MAISAPERTSPAAGLHLLDAQPVALVGQAHVVQNAHGGMTKPNSAASVRAGRLIWSVRRRPFRGSLIRFSKAVAELDLDVVDGQRRADRSSIRLGRRPC
jgi:hypothetical protein